MLRGAWCTPCTATDTPSSQAVQLDPHCTYAYTLCGHELVASGNVEKATECYRHALRADERHYNAWFVLFGLDHAVVGRIAHLLSFVTRYGLGSIYYRQEKFRLAEYHYRRALAINQSSPALHCFVGMVMTCARAVLSLDHSRNRALPL